MRIPPGTLALLWALAICFLLQAMAPEAAVRFFGLWPIGNFDDVRPDGSVVSYGFMPWQLVTYSLLHGGFTHVFFNALGIVNFGPSLEAAWGRNRFLIFWFVCVVGAGVLQLALVSSGVLGGNIGATIGASGGVYGLLLAFAILFPQRQMMLLFPPIPMKARTMAIVFGMIALMLGVSGSGGGVAHFAHLGGMLFGWLLLRYWRGLPPFRRKPPSRPNLRSVN